MQGFPQNISSKGRGISLGSGKPGPMLRESPIARCFPVTEKQGTPCGVPCRGPVWNYSKQKPSFRPRPPARGTCSSGISMGVMVMAPRFTWKVTSKFGLVFSKLAVPYFM